jgi:oxalate decarboxylase/phosphoglucose isomerase-like protein (cupin superfamily)
MYKSIPLNAFHLQTTQSITPVSVDHRGKAYVVDQSNFSPLAGVTCYTLEVWDESMRLPHWHPNASELGYVVSGALEIVIWRSPGETAIFTLTAGMCWFIPLAALHSLNNIGDKPAQLLVGFSSELPEDIDLPVAWNGIPVPLRNAYTSPHQDLLQWHGVINNPLVGRYTNISALKNVLTASPYGFDLAKVSPLFNDEKLGSVIWGVKSNWNILEDISVLRAILQPGVARDAIWYPDAGTLYVVAKGSAEFYLILAGQEAKPFTINQFDYVYVPTGVLHTFINTSSSVFEMVAFFTKSDPQPEVSLSVATAFFPNIIRQAAMNQFGLQNKSGDPFKNMNYQKSSPYLVQIHDRKSP